MKFKELFCNHIWTVETATKNGIEAQNSPYDPEVMQRWITHERCVKCGKEKFNKRQTFLGEELLNETYETIKTKG